MVYKNLNLPATLVHTVNGKKYTLKGLLLSINESSNTCSMKFAGNKVNNNIPLDEVYLNEGVIDALKKVKSGAKNLWLKAVNIIKKIGNFILPVSNDGELLVEFINNPVNIACMKLSPAVKVCSSQAALEVCNMFGLNNNSVSVEAAFAPAEDDEVKDANTVWTKIMKEYANSDKTLTETLLSIDKSFWRGLNEAMPTLNSPIFPENDDAVDDIEEGEGGTDLYGVRLTASELKSEIRDNLYNQINTKTGENVKPLLIWGAPGIGKSAIIKGATKMLKKEYNMDLDMITINCGALRPDDWELPNNAKNKFGDDITISVPKSWMPIYNPGRYDEKDLPEVDKFFRSGEYRKMAYKAAKAETEVEYTDEFGNVQKKSTVEVNNDFTSTYDGGVIFFDEVGRCATKDITFTLMSLLGDHRYGQDFVLASGWATIGASNRLHDDGLKHDDKEFFAKWPMAVADRWTSVTYVPTKEEWLDWARQANSEGKRNVDIAIIEFIEAMEPLVWYYCIDFIASTGINGEKSQYKKLKGTIWPSIGDKINKGMSFDDDETEEFDHYYSGKGSRKFGNYTGRTWHEKINVQYVGALKQLFHEHPEALEKCYIGTRDYTIKDDGTTEGYDVRELDYNELAKALNLLPKTVWKNWAEKKQTAMAKNGVEFKNGDENIIDTNRIRFVKKYLQYVIALNTGAKSVPARAYKTYLDSKAFTAATIETIWKYGYAKYVGAEPWVDNILEPQNSQTKYMTDNENIAWKADPALIKENIQKAADIVSTLSTQTVKKEYNNILNICKEQGIDLKKPIIQLDNETVQEWLDKYTINFVDKNNKPIKSVCAFLPKKTYASLPEEDKLEIQKAIFVLMNSKTAQRLANFGMWMGKVSIQEHRADYLAEHIQQNSSSSVQNVFLQTVCKNDKAIGSYHAGSTSLSIIGPFSIITTAMSEYQLDSF